MYTKEQKEKAVQTYFQNGRNATKTVQELGYPSVPALIKWADHYLPKPREKRPKVTKRYSEEEIQRAIDSYFENGCNLKKTVRELGYGSETGLLTWLRKRVPDQVSSRKELTWKRDYPTEIKTEAVLELIAGEHSGKELSQKYGISKATLYDWKLQYIGKGCTELRPKQSATVEELQCELEELRKQKELLAKELEAARKEAYRARLEKDVYETAAEVLKKGLGIDLSDLTNREKAMVIGALREKYPLKLLLEILNMAKSSYCYQAVQLQKEDPLSELRLRIVVLFKEVNERYGYRRIHQMLKAEGRIVSEKIIRKIMKEEHLVARGRKRKKYNSYMGEISPAVEDKIRHDFRADKPNEKWLTDITEFSIEAGKVYVSPIIDCFDGLPVTWTIGRNPNAKLVNTMLDQGIALLKEEEHPIVHSDRGCHYRWPGWLSRMKNAGLTRSMSRKGCSPDNSACEGFFGRMKNEMFYGIDWSNASIDELISSIEEYLVWYREERIKLSLGGLSPMDYRRSLGLV